MPNRLLEGLRRFQRDRFPQLREHYQKLAAEGQKPATLFVGCCDSRVVPSLLTDAAPGELFVVRNVGNFVPPFEPDYGYHGTSAAIEFAVLTLGVTDIVVCGHSDCGAINALYSRPNDATPHINRWLDLGREAMLNEPLSPNVLRRTEQRSIVLQLSRLMSYPMVTSAVEASRLSLHGWYYVIEEGRVYFLDVQRGEFIRGETD